MTSFAPSRTVTGRDRAGPEVSPFDAPYALPLDRAGGRFPADGVALILQPVPGGLLGPDSHFPVQLSQFGSAHAQPFFTKTIALRDKIPLARSEEIVGYSQEVTATVIIGVKASRALRSELAQVITALAFRRLAPGTSVGDSYIVGPASRFPVGSFTRIDVRFAGQKAMPVYIVHAAGRFAIDHQCPSTESCTPPGTFYGVGASYSTRLEHAPTCQLQFDRTDEQFYCSNLGVRWDRVGRVVTLRSDEKYIGGIEGDYAKITWDRQLMITPGFGPRVSRQAVHLLWPSWHQPKHPNTL